MHAGACVELLFGIAYIRKKIAPPGSECVGIAFDIRNGGIVVLLASVDYGIFKFFRRISRLLLNGKCRATSLDNEFRPEEHGWHNHSIPAKYLLPSVEKMSPRRWMRSWPTCEEYAIGTQMGVILTVGQGRQPKGTCS